MERNRSIHQSKNPVLQMIIDEIESDKNDRCSYPYWGNWLNWTNWMNWTNWNNWVNWYT